MQPFSTLSLPLVTIGAWPLQLSLWRYIEEGLLQLQSPPEETSKRMKQLMEQYWDTPMDFADTSLVIAAEILNLIRIFTLDSDFYEYRINGTTLFDVVP